MFIGFVPFSFILSVLICLFLAYLDKRAASLGDLNLRKSEQTLHKKSVSRFGGVAIYLSSLLTILFTIYIGLEWEYSDTLNLFLCCLPAFLVGFLDDLKFEIHPRLRLIFLLPVPILFFFYTGVSVTSLDLGFLDDFLEIELFALLFLCFAIVGMMNAFNLIDGINGQLSSYLISIILALKFIEWISGNAIELSAEFRYSTNILLGSLAGFLILNLFGKIFLGDAGAYFLGSIVCIALIMAQQQNGFSPWSVMLILSYPFTDLLFSVLRRKMITGGDAMQPDAEHLHHVIYKRFKKIKFKHDRVRHFFTIVFLSIFNFPYITSAVYFANNTPALMIIFFVYILSYLLIYFALSPRFLLRNEKK
tara:strand:+ start:1446 stop:2534 length:1089 start_codon:yes stop_codon:yes gene_type:complete